MHGPMFPMLRRKAAAISGFFRAAGVSPRFLASVRGIPGVGAGGVCPQMRAVCESSFEYVPATGTAYRVAMRVALKTSCPSNKTLFSLYVELSFSQRRTLRVEVLVN